MTVMLLTKHHLQLISLKEGYIGSSESTLVKIKVVENRMSPLMCKDNLIINELTSSLGT